MSWLTNKQICRKVNLNANAKTRHAFYGVFSITKLPKSIPYYPIFIVVNTDTHNLSGLHWKTIFIDKNKSGEVFDSLSQPTSNILRRWLNRFTRKWKRNPKVYQHANSATCGAFTLYFILNRFNHPSLKSLTNTLSHSINTNETRVREFYSKLK